MLHLALVFRACCYDINASRIDTCVSEYICELGNILFNAVKGTGKQMAKIVGEHLVRRYPCLLTQRFHLTPDVATTHWLDESRDKDAT